MHTQHTLCWEAVAFKCMSFNMCYGCVLNAGNRCACMCVECSCALCTHASVCCGAPFYPWFCMLFCCVAMQSNAHWTRLSLCTIHLYMKRDLVYFFDSLFLFSFVNAFFILSSSSSSSPSPLNTFTVFCINYGGFLRMSDMTDVFLAFYFSCKLQLILLIRFFSSQTKNVRLIFWKFDCFCIFNAISDRFEFLNVAFSHWMFF